MDFLLFPGGIVGALACLFWYLWKIERGKDRSIYGHRTAKRAVNVAKAHLTPQEDIEAGYAAVAASVKQLRAAKTEENRLYQDRWEKQFYTPEEYAKVLEERRPAKTAITGAKFFSDKDTELFLYVEEGPEWKPLPYSRSKRDPDEELGYSERRIQRAGAFVRSGPSINASTYGVADGGSVVRFDGFVRGEPVAGNDVWFFYVGKGSGLLKYVHSIATTNRQTTGMKDYTEQYGYTIPSRI